jgi:hypothetical protein
LSKLGLDAGPPQVGEKKVQAAEVQVAAEDMADRFGLVRNDCDFSVLGLVAQGHYAADPKALAFGGPDLVADALGGDLALKLGKGQQDIERQAAHRRRGVELLRDRDKGHPMGIEQFDQLGKIGQGACQAIDLVDDNDIDAVGSNVIKKLLQGRAVGGFARETAIVITSTDQCPTGMGLTADIGLCCIILGIERVEVLLEA